MTREQLQEDYDWQEAFGYADFNIDQVEEVIASYEGENDGDSWSLVAKLRDGRYGYVDAWCDYTGWDCQAGGDSEIKNTLEELQRWSLTSKLRRKLGLTLSDLDS